MGMNKNFMVFFAVLLMVIGILPNIYNRSEELSKEIAISEAKTKEQVIKVSDTTDIPKVNNYTTKLSVTAQTDREITLSWDDIAQIDGYTIYRSKPNEDYKEIYSIESGEVTTYADKNLESGSVYSYKIKTFIKGDKEMIYGKDSEICSTYTKCMTPNLFVEKYKEDDIKVTWDISKDVDGYEIYRSMSKKGNFYPLVVADKNIYSKFIDREVNGDMKSYYKIRAFKYINGGIVYSDFSEAISIKGE